MEKYKICPNPKCGKHNKSTAIECAWCEADLTAIKPTDDNMEAEREANEAGREQNKKNIAEKMAVPINHAGKVVRICEACGMHNPANLRKCSGCGEDISDVKPTEEKTEENSNILQKPKFILTTIDGEYSYEIRNVVTTVGREEAMKEYLADKAYVSRQQAELISENGKLYIRNLSKTNFTYVNNTKITDDEKHELNAGDEIGMGGNVNGGKRQESAAYFIVKAE